MKYTYLIDTFVLSDEVVIHIIDFLVVVVNLVEEQRMETSVNLVEKLQMKTKKGISLYTVIIIFLGF